ncbi:hypothetical protein GCM10010384_47910 [Streptomyces djakartensis]|uniref:Uncharacterized protein n=1 Tax=Streptomyces djakartensis TaxID=68193 RepID=A0ABQ3A7E6_9ACTN|nr:hypothetical protein GCM10010384_47910 [Streptomyces djakartensis]
MSTHVRDANRNGFPHRQDPVTGGRDAAAPVPGRGSSADRRIALPARIRREGWGPHLAETLDFTV